MAAVHEFYARDGLGLAIYDQFAEEARSADYGSDVDFWHRPPASGREQVWVLGREATDAV